MDASLWISNLVVKNSLSLYLCIDVRQLSKAVMFDKRLNSLVQHIHQGFPQVALHLHSYNLTVFVTSCGFQIHILMCCVLATTPPLIVSPDIWWPEPASLQRWCCPTPTWILLSSTAVIIPQNYCFLAHFLTSYYATTASSSWCPHAGRSLVPVCTTIVNRFNLQLTSPFVLDNFDLHS